MINVVQSSMPPYDEYINIIKQLWDTKWLSNRGNLHRQFEAELVKYLGNQNVSLFANGHLALEVGISAFNFPSGSEIITTPYTHISTIHSIVRNNLVPVFCDVEPDGFNIDANMIEDLISDKTVAILATHVYGVPCDVNKIQNIAQSHNLKVFYDAAHCFGVKIYDKDITNYGDLSMISLHATKVFHTIEGGLCVIKDQNIHSIIDNLINFGITSQDDVGYISPNARMNEFEAAMGICNLRYIIEEIEKRKLVYDTYKEHIDETRVKILHIPNYVKWNYSYMPIITNDRNAIIDKLNSNEIFPRKYFYPIIPEMTCYKGIYNADVENARNISNKVLCLPLYSNLDLNDVVKICEIINE